MSIQTLFTAHATATGGRNGHAQADDGLVSVDLSVPKAMGGPGKEQSIEVKSSVDIGKSGDGGFGLAVVLDVNVAGLSQADAEKVVAAGHAFCPYSKAIKGNVDVTVNVHAV